MTYFLDWISGSILIMTIIIMVVMFVCMGFSFKNPFKEKWKNYTYKVVLNLIGISPFIWMMFTYYGFTDKFDNMYCSDNVCCLIENYERGGGESSPESVSRLHIVDVKTGERKNRERIGYFTTLLDMHHDTLFYEVDDEYVLLNAKENKIIRQWNKESLSSKFKETKAGISSLSNYQTYGGPYRPISEIKTKDGYTYFYDAFKDKIIGTEIKPATKDGIQFVDDHLEVVKGENKSWISAIQRIPNTERSKVIVSDDSKQFECTSPDKEFIHPKIIAWSAKENIYIVRHYTTTEDKAFIISAFRLNNAKPVWEIHQSKLNCTDSFTDEPKLDVIRVQDNNVIFNSGGWLISAEIKTGKINWTTRL